MERNSEQPWTISFLGQGVTSVTGHFLVLFSFRIIALILLGLLDCYGILSKQRGERCVCQALSKKKSPRRARASSIPTFNVLLSSRPDCPHS